MKNILFFPSSNDFLKTELSMKKQHFNHQISWGKVIRISSPFFSPTFIWSVVNLKKIFTCMARMHIFITAWNSRAIISEFFCSLVLSIKLFQYSNDDEWVQILRNQQKKIGIEEIKNCQNQLEIFIFFWWKWGNFTILRLLCTPFYRGC